MKKLAQGLIRQPGLAYFRKKLVKDRAVGITWYLPVIVVFTGKYVGITL